MLSKNTVSIVKQGPETILVANGMTQRLQCPSRCRMFGHIEVHQSARAVMDHDENVNQPKCRRDRHEKITRDNGFCVVSEEC